MPLSLRNTNRFYSGTESVSRPPVGLTLLALFLCSACSAVSDEPLLVHVPSLSPRPLGFEEPEPLLLRPPTPLLLRPPTVTVESGSESNSIGKEFSGNSIAAPATPPAREFQVGIPRGPAWGTPAVSRTKTFRGGLEPLTARFLKPGMRSASVPKA